MQLMTDAEKRIVVRDANFQNSAPRRRRRKNPAAVAAANNLRKISLTFV